MPLELLAQLKNADLPLTLTDPQSIRQVEMLHAALLVTAHFRRSDMNSPYTSAVVTHITPTGYSMLARLESNTK